MISFPKVMHVDTGNMTGSMNRVIGGHHHNYHYDSEEDSRCHGYACHHLRSILILGVLTAAADAGDDDSEGNALQGYEQDIN